MGEPCSQSGCKNLAFVALPKCEHCNARYCTSHMLPEVHGCGDACKNSAQRQATADASRQRKARQHLGNEDAKKRLDKKIAEGEAARRKKPSNNEKK